MADPVSSTANSEAPNKKQKTSHLEEEIPLWELVEFLPVEVASNLFREYLP